MSNLMVDKATIYYETRGQGQPLVLIAGYGCDHTFWADLQGPLSTQFTVLTNDNRGSGRTINDDPSVSIDTFANDIMAVIDKLGFKRPHILGHSMGGAIAQQIAINYSNQIDKLILLNTSAKFNAISSLALGSNLRLQQSNIEFDLLLDSFIPWIYSSDFLSDASNLNLIKQKIKNNPYPPTVVGNERQLKALNGFDLRTEIHKITANTLIVGADRDLFVTKEETQLLAEKIPNAKLNLLPGSHVSLLEQPAIFLNLILNFLKA